MTQACDLAQDPVRNVILSPAYTIGEYRAQWELALESKGQNPTAKSWRSQADKIVKGGIWNLAVLAGRSVDSGLSMPALVVDFHEMFSLPYEFLSKWIAAGNPRLHLCPPYREHLSQAFARFFMRVGLPVGVPPSDLHS